MDLKLYSNQNIKFSRRKKSKQQKQASENRSYGKENIRITAVFS